MNNENVLFIAVAAALGLIGAWLYSRGIDPQFSDTAAPDAAPVVPNTIMESIAAPFTSILGLWHPPTQYAGLIAMSEQNHGIPRDILARLLYQESRYRSDIIDGSTTSPAGALGIAQFMPATANDMGIDPLDPVQAIDASGAYLARLFDKFGNWTEALAAYNWGQGNVSRKGVADAPAETKNYYAQILGDVNAANGTNLA